MASAACGTEPGIWQPSQEEVRSRMAGLMSGDIMGRIAGNGVHIPSGEAYGAVRGKFESDIRSILEQWDGMSGFSG